MALLCTDTMHVMVVSYLIECVELCGENILEGMCRNNAMAVIGSIVTWGVFLPTSLYFGLSCPWFKGHPLQGLWWGSIVGCLFKVPLPLFICNCTPYTDTFQNLIHVGHVCWLLSGP